MNTGTEDLPDNQWRPPASELAKALQYPRDGKFVERIINAYTRDAMRARSRRGSTE